MKRKKKQILGVLSIIFNVKGEVLVAKRNQPTLPEAHKKLELPGGGVDFGEDPLYALEREVHEESGLYVKVVGMIPKVFCNIWHHKTYDSQVFLVGYVCEVLKGELRSCDPEVAYLQWINPKKIDFLNSLPSTEELVSEGKKIWEEVQTHPASSRLH